MLAAVLLASSVPASRAAPPESAVQDYGACLNAAKKGDVLLLFDESISLQGSDGEAGRVTAARYLVGQLAEVADRQSFDLAVAVAGFADDYHRVRDWTRLGGGGTGDVTAAVDQFKNRNQGVQTDYWNGLNGARSELNARAKGDPDRCQAIVWFSDGKFDIGLSEEQYRSNRSARTKSYAPDVDLRDEKDARKAAEAARDDLCRPKGLADQLRVSGITLFAIGLSESGPAEKTDNFTTMAAVATGEDCGKRQDPTPGSFTLAGNVDDLIFAFGQIGRPGQTDTQQLCQSADAVACRQSAQSFVLDDSITDVHLLATSDAPNPLDLKVYLFAPGRKSPYELGRRSGDLGSPGSDFGWLTDATLSIDLAKADRPTSRWTGQWTLVFLDPEKKSPDSRYTTSISIAGNVFPSWPGAASTSLRAGETVKGLRFGLVDDQNKPVDPGRLLGTGSLDAELVDRDGRVTPIAKGVGLRDIAKPATLDLAKVPVGEAVLKLSLKVRTAPFGELPGTDLTPQVVSIPVDILPPPETPQLGSLVDFGAITGPADASTALPVTGPGCVWLAGSPPEVAAGPQEVTSVGIGSSAQAASSCLRVGDGQTEQLPLRLTTAEAGNGTLAGTTAVVVTPLDAPDRQTIVQVPFTADLHKPLRPLNFALALIAALVLGPGIPLALLALVKWWTAKIPARPLLAQQMRVEIRDGQVLRDGAPLGLRDTDFSDMVPLERGGSRQTKALDTPLRTRTGLSPFGAGFVTADTSGQLALSSTHSQPSGPRGQARLPLAVHDTWVASRTTGAPPGTADLLLLAGLDPRGERRRRLIEDVSARLPALMPTLAPEDGEAGDAPVDLLGGGAAAPLASVDHLSTGSEDPWSASRSTAPAPPGHRGRSSRPGAPPDPPSTPAGPDQAPDEAGSPTSGWSFDDAFDDDGHSR